MILKCLFNLCCSLELRDTKILQGSTGDTVSIIVAEGKNVLSFKCLFALDFPEFFTILPLTLDWQISVVIGGKNPQENKKPHCCKMQKAVNLEKVPALLLAPQGAFEESSLVLGNCFFLRIFSPS